MECITLSLTSRIPQLLLAEPLVGQNFYIGYYSALQIHQLITQPSLKEQIKDFPPFEQVARELGRHFRKFSNKLY
jgi:hypothetical protein